MHTIFIYERSPGRLTLSFVKSDYVRDNVKSLPTPTLHPDTFYVSGCLLVHPSLTNARRRAEGFPLPIVSI